MTVSEDARPSTIENRRWIEGHLRSLRFVEWDRFTTHEFDNGVVAVDVYGWIERPEDDYKDFVHITFYPGNEGYSFTTSSDRYSEEIHDLMAGEADEEHNPCYRVEDTFNVSNAIRLEKNKRLGEFA